MACNFKMQRELNEFGRQTIILKEPIQSFRTISRIVECYTEVSVAGEGNNLGPCGYISIIQIATCDGMCFVFDLQCCPRLISEGGLKHLLETPNVIKVMHDCRDVSAALFCRFQIQLCNVFDTQCAHAVIESQLNSTRAYDIPTVSLPYICGRYSLNENKAAVFLKTYWRKIPVIEWSHRPLLNKTVCYAATRVLCLLPEVYNNMKSFIFPNSTSIFLKLVNLNIIYHIFPGKSSSSCSFAPKTKLRKKTRSDNGPSTHVKERCNKRSQSKTVGSKSIATEVKARRKMRKSAKANQTTISNSCTESGVKRTNGRNRKCSSDEKLGEITVSSNLEVKKKKVKFAGGCVLPTTSHTKVLKGRKNTKSFKESYAEDEPVNKRIKMDECMHHDLVSDKDALHIKAMKNWMDYLDVCTYMEEAMKKSKCGSSSCEESETDSESSKEIIFAPEINEGDDDSEVGIDDSNFASSHYSIFDGQMIKSKQKKCSIDCPYFVSGFKIKPKKQNKKKSFKKEEEEDQDKEEDCDKDEEEKVKGEEHLNAFSCGLFNCKGTSPIIQFSENKCIDSVAKCYKNDNKMEDHKCTCIDCWLLGAIRSTNNGDDKNTRKCVCGCSCLCSEEESSSNGCDKKKSSTSADTSAQKPILRCCYECDRQATRKQAKIEDSKAAQKKIKTDTVNCCCGQDCNKHVVKKPMTDVGKWVKCCHKEECEAASRKAKTEAVNIERKLRKTCWNRK